MFAIPAMSCAKSAEGAVEDVIRSCWDAYNADDFDKCASYYTGDSSAEEMSSSLAMAKSFTGEVEIGTVGDITINGDEATATMGGDSDTDTINLVKVDGDWKIVWD